MAVVLPARMFKKAIAERGLAPVVLSRAVGASGTPASALIPWNSCGAYYMAATLGVATLSYLPYAVFNREPAVDDRPCVRRGAHAARRSDARAGSAGLAHYASLSSTALATLLLWRAPIWRS